MLLALAGFYDAHSTIMPVMKFNHCGFCFLVALYVPLFFNIPVWCIRWRETTTQGSGKGTQSNRLIKNFGVAHLSSGDILRRNIRQSTCLGLKASQFMSAGQLVPDDLMVSLFDSEIQKMSNPVGCHPIPAIFLLVFNPVIRVGFWTDFLAHLPKQRHSTISSDEHRSHSIWWSISKSPRKLSWSALWVKEKILLRKGSNGYLIGNIKIDGFM